MKTLTAKELNKILHKHKGWLVDKKWGNRADLSRCNLSGSDLSRCNLSRSNLSRSNLSRCNLSRCNLSGSNLSGNNLAYSDLSGSITDKRYIAIACIGSRKGSTTYCFDDDQIWCGCFKGTLDEFEKKVEKTHAEGTQFRKEYDGAIAYIRSLR